MSSSARHQPWGLAALFAFAGTMHFVVPGAYAGIVPRALPSPLMLVYLSGIAEIAGAVGLLLPPTRRIAGWGLIALLVAVFPANVQMLLDARAEAAWWMQVLLVLRLPLQPLLIWWVWRATRRESAAPD